MKIIDDRSFEKQISQNGEQLPAKFMARATEARLLDQDCDHVKIVVYLKDEDYNWFNAVMMVHRSNLTPVEGGGPNIDPNKALYRHRSQPVGTSG